MQILNVEKFLGIKKATIELSGLTVLIGPQASGKSIIARLIYFFNEYFASFDDLSLMKNEHKNTYDKTLRADFYKIFPPYSWASDEFIITYSNAGHTVKVTSKAKSETIDIWTSKSVADYFRGLKSSFKNFSESLPEHERQSQTRVLREFRRSQDSSNVVRFDRPLFVPAARSFYATIREEIFSILSLDEKIDKIIMQFGEFYESAKFAYRISERFRVTGQFPSTKTEKGYFSSIVKGQYARLDNRDWIETERGRIEMSKASSGQQEAVPLLFAISRFPSQGRTLIIEEPEAHLFPDSQVEVLDFIVKQSVSQQTSILFTTHSPYLLTALNNHMVRGRFSNTKGIDPARVRAYALENGYSRPIVDPDTSLISAEYIDSVSERINFDFINALGENDEIVG